MSSEGLKETLPCKQCKGSCCKYIMIPFDKPTTKRTRNDVIWYLHHSSVEIVINGNDWYIGIADRCENLRWTSNECAIYETRPEVCREYGSESKSCEYYVKDGIVLKTVSDYEKYMDSKYKDWRITKKPLGGGNGRGRTIIPDGLGNGK